jgi:hypothetical protein
MKSELAEEIFELMEARSHARPTPMEFEMAYQARVAMDRIRFAIRHIEQFGPQTEPIREVRRQLLDALQRLETVDRRFQIRSQVARETNPEYNNPSRHNFSAHGLWPSQRPDGQSSAG